MSRGERWECDCCQEMWPWWTTWGSVVTPHHKLTQTMGLRSRGFRELSHYSVEKTTVAN